MKSYIISFCALLLFVSAVSAQKGVDTQTKKIQDEGVKSTGLPQRGTEPNRSYDFGKGKTKTRPMLPNPSRIAARRDVLIEDVLNILQDQKIIINESASRKTAGVIVSEPFVFAKGAVITRNELNRYAILPNSDASWSGGRYTLTVEVQSIDGIQNNVSVTARVEGRSENGLSTEWTSLQSTGAAEDEFLAKLIEAVTGKDVDAPQVIETNNN